MKHAGFLIPDAEWEAFKAVAKSKDMRPSQLLRQFIRDQIRQAKDGK
jgi:hypothetical protein